MTSAIKKTVLAIALGLVAFGTVHNAEAAGTQAGTQISNSASLTYSVNSIPQNQITSTAATFKVDRKINLTVATNDTQLVNVTPGAASTQVLTFTVTNNGNDTQKFSLQALHDAGVTDPFGSGSPDNFTATGATVYVESNGTAGWQAADTAYSAPIQLAPDAVATVYIVAAIPSTQVSGDASIFTLKATALDLSGNAYTNNTADAGGIYTVFADAAGSDDLLHDASHSARDGYKVKSAKLSINKTSVVVSDPVNGTTSPHAIPGATIEYTITVTNDATATDTATNVGISDSLDTEIKAGHIAFNANAYGAGKGIQVTAPNINGGAALALTNTSDADQGDFGGTAANTVTVGGITLAPTQSSTVKFQVTVQ